MIRLRPAEPQDSWTFWVLRNDPQAIQNSRDRTGPISWEDHKNWWEESFEFRYLAYDGPVCVGIIRISRLADIPSAGLISIIVTPNERGKGLGTQMLTTIKRVAAEQGFRRLIAEVLPDNGASQMAFTKACWGPVRFEVDLTKEAL